MKCGIVVKNDAVPTPVDPPVSSHVAHMHNALRLVSVNVEDRCIHHLSYVCAVGRGAGEARIRRETNLARSGILIININPILTQVSSTA